jgi:RNA recognition motif-containing protein
MKNIYVGNLAFSTTEDAVRAAFEAYGKVERVSLVRDRETGQPRGFGFVEMENDGEAERAIAATNGMNLDGRTLNVNEARPREPRAFGAGGGGGFGRGGRGGGGGGRGGFGNRGGGGGRDRGGDRGGYGRY